MQHFTVGDVPALSLWSATRQVKQGKVLRSKHVEHGSCTCCRHSTSERIALTSLQIATVHASVGTIHAYSKESILGGLDVDGDVVSDGTHLEWVLVELAHLVISITISEAFPECLGEIVKT